MNTEHFKKRLEDELDLLQKQLGDIAVKDPETGEWAPKDPEMDVMPPAQEETEMGDKMEEMEERGEEVVTLSARMADVEAALDKVDTGTYGRCEVCDKAIEEERLEANPAARTCMAHM